ncbi:MAG: cobamide remodeling phosphodiesterase CbiR [Candidatus Aminicenantes bacterium]|jgi:adenosylcobinamide kinase/adenosylcobinamide-phosphate guanylyltransferase
MKKIILILGGIRSGKSYFAEQKAEFYSEKPVYIATAIPFDSEMKLRVAQHKKRRGKRYELIEAPYELTGPLGRLKDRTVLVDCLTLNLSNRLMATEEYMDLEELIESDESYLKDLYKIINKNNLKVIFVSNEVGAAPIEANELGRYFQDLQGQWNRIVAEYADEVYVMQAGIPTLIKKGVAPPTRSRSAGCHSFGSFTSKVGRKNKVSPGISKKEQDFPFKISAPSYLLPTGYIENVTYLMDQVDDIQLLVFDAHQEDPLLKEESLTTLEYLAKDSGISYSVHMPVKPELTADFQQRLEAAYFIIKTLNTLNISSYTFHYDLPDGVKWEKVTKDEIQSIEAAYIKFFSALKERFPAVDLSLENTETPLSALDRIISACGISYCIDIGHLLVKERDLAEIEPRLQQASVIHLHGWEEKDGKKQDHRPILYDRKIFKQLESFSGILTIENYHKLLYEKSMELLREYF